MSSTTKLPSIHPRVVEKSPISKENHTQANGYAHSPELRNTNVPNSCTTSPDFSLPPLILHKDGCREPSTISSDWPLSDPRGINPRKAGRNSLPFLDIGITGVNPGLGLFPGAYQSYSMYEMVGMMSA